jgi:hypothetical protein
VLTREGGPIAHPEVFAAMELRRAAVIMGAAGTVVTNAGLEARAVVRVHYRGAKASGRQDPRGPAAGAIRTGPCPYRPNGDLGLSRIVRPSS